LYQRREIELIMLVSTCCTPRNTRSKARARRSSSIVAPASSSPKRVARWPPKPFKELRAELKSVLGILEGADLRVAILIPAYQAAATIREIIARTRATAPSAEIIVVDDGSTDGTGDEGRGKGTILVTHPRNRGKGAALRDGIREATARDSGVLVTIDADGQHPPEEIPRLLRPIEEGRADLVLGARKRDHGMPISRRFTNWLSATLHHASAVSR